MKCKHRNCKYRAQFSDKTEYCDFIGHTGHSRGCAAENCDNFKPKTRRRNNFNILITKDPQKIAASRKVVSE